MPTTAPAVEIKITDLRAYGLLPTKAASRFSKRQKFYIKFTTANTKTPLETDLTSNADHHENLNPFRTFQADPSDTMKLQVFARRTLHRDTCIGYIEDSIMAILNAAEASGNTLSRSLEPTAKNTSNSRLEFTIMAVSDPDMTDMRQIVGQAPIDSKALAPPTPGIEKLDVALDAPEVAEKIASIADTWSVLLDRVQIFVEISDKVAEIHPYAKLASSVLLFVPKIFLNQVKLDVEMKSLIVCMHDVFGFVEAAEPLKKVESHSKIIKSMVQQVTECGYFIHHYLSKPIFWARTLKNTFSTADSQISGYLSRFETLQKAFQLEASREINITVRQLDITVVSVLDSLEKQGEMLETHVMDSTLERMQYSKSARYNPERGCLSGTRQKIIADIVDWVNDPEGSSILMLSGVAGSGKSSIVHSVATLFSEQHRLGSSFCFDRNDPTERRPDQLFCTIAHDLAYYDDRIKRIICDKIKSDESVLRSPSPLEQFRKLILESVSNVEVVGPTLVMVDALDESIGLSRNTIISVLAESSFPTNLRFLVSSRPDIDIVDSLHNRSHIRLLRLDDVDRVSTETDMRAYIESRFSTSRKVQVTDAQYRGLVSLSDGLFQWAFTTCGFILGDARRVAGEDPLDKLDQILAIDVQDAESNRLDILYREVLNYVVGQKAKTLATFRLVLGRVLAAMEPLSMSSLMAMFKNEDRKFESILPFLGALLRGVTETDSPIRPSHASLRDFLLDERRAGEFYIDMTGNHNEFAGATLDIMLNSLRFNICQIQTSHRKNDQIPEELTKRFISPDIRYACLFWSKHLEVDCSKEMLDKAVVFLQSKFLYWLEVLSVLGAVDKAAPALSVLIKKSETAARKFTLDAQRFIRLFAIPISQSAPHIYLSAWPLTPRQYKTKGSFFPDRILGTINLQKGFLTRWPAAFFQLQGHEYSVTSVAFSPDGTRIVSGSDDKTIRIWNAETGEAAGEPMQGHDEFVTSVAFSPDGTRIVSGSADKTIRIWNAETGETAGEPMQGHDEFVTSVAFSPDGTRIVSGSDDKTIRIWNAETGEAAGKPMEGHDEFVTSVAFSPDGTRIVSGSADKTIRIWNAETGEAAGEPMQGHDDYVRSVAFSPDGTRIVSGSTDMTIRIWNAETGEAVGEPMQGHDDCVTSVAFSPDGTRIVSGSDDKTIRIWNAETGEAVGEPMQGHDDYVTSVAFSPDGTRIVSGSADKTIRIWNADTGEAVGEPMQGHEYCVSSVVFSPDGTRIVSGSDDKTIRIWNAETGEAVGEPMQGHDEFVTSVAFSPDGTRIVSGSADKTIRIWNADTGEAVGEPMQGHEYCVSSVVFSPDGTRIVSGSDDKTIRIWNAETGEAVGEPMQGHDVFVTSVAFSPDGTRIVSGSADKTIRIWNAETGEAAGEPMQGHDEFVTSVAFSPDGTRIVSGSVDKTIRIWNVDTGEAVGEPMQGHEYCVSSVAFSPDGTRIVSGSADKTIRIWNAETGEAAGEPMQGHDDCVTSVAFSPDGTRIVSGSDDKTIRIWNAETGDAASPIGTNIHTYFTSDGTRLRSSVTIRSDGWIVGPESQLLLWIPDVLRRTLPVLPCEAIIRTGSGSILFDSSEFWHG